MRILDTPELFGCGIGVSTLGDITCEICGTRYNEGADDVGCYNGESVLHTTFAGKTVCECCFEEVENEVLRRIDDIIPWFRKILNGRKNRAEKLLGELDSK
ncbi:MAG: hypothetical protein LLG40_15395 [Deltaproteobacteria bacterium]|jgi:hypothetical protein|nr:hypothetical protein [Deltaproteobacteria bacterium]